MVTIKADTELKVIVITVGITATKFSVPLVVTYAQAYTIAFNLLYILGMVREVQSNAEPRRIELFPPPLTPEDEARILDPQRELVPDLETVFAQLNRHPRQR